MNTKKASRGLVSMLQRILLAVLAVIVLFGSFPVGRAQAAGGEIITSVTCLAGYYRLNPAFVPAYEGQWVYFRLWLLDETTGIYQPSDGAYIQAYTNAPGGFYDMPAPSGAIVSIITEAWFYNATTGLWEYAGTAPAQHWQMTVFGDSAAACRIY